MLGSCRRPGALEQRGGLGPIEPRSPIERAQRRVAATAQLAIGPAVVEPSAVIPTIDFARLLRTALIRRAFFHTALVLKRPESLPAIERTKPKFAQPQPIAQPIGPAKHPAEHVPAIELGPPGKFQPPIGFKPNEHAPGDHPKPTPLAVDLEVAVTRLVAFESPEHPSTYDSYPAPGNAYAPRDRPYAEPQRPCSQLQQPGPTHDPGHPAFVAFLAIDTAGLDHQPPPFESESFRHRVAESHRPSPRSHRTDGSPGNLVADADRSPPECPAKSKQHASPSDDHPAQPQRYAGKPQPHPQPSQRGSAKSEPFGPADHVADEFESPTRPADPDREPAPHRRNPPTDAYSA